MFRLKLADGVDSLPDELTEEVIVDAFVRAGLFTLDEDGGLVPTEKIKKMYGGLAHVQVEVDEDGQLVFAEVLEDWEVPGTSRLQ